MHRHPPEIWIGDDPLTLAREGARRIAEAARRAIAARGRFLLALAGGSTPRRLYRILGAEEHGVDWSRVEFLLGDERIVPPDHEESNYRMVRETLIDQLGQLDETGRPQHGPLHVHRVPTELGAEAAAVAYEQTLRQLLDPREPYIDLVLLGMGPDGHTASIFPGSPLVTADEFANEPSTGAGRMARSARSFTTERLCAAVHDSPKPPPERLTLTPFIINQARQVLVIVAGEDKVAAVSAALESDAEPAEIPIRAISPENGVLTWLIDRRAARALTNAAL